ncbi:MAG TPA: tail-specific protease, partial [Desulfopila sp.]|nr:tail-specific protease [Desulfopila sp.]
MTTIKRFTIVLLLSMVVSALPALALDKVEIDEERNDLIGYMLYKQLPSIHFSDKEVNDSLAQAAFDLYLQQLDYQKRFLLQEDVERLRQYALKID